MLLQHMSPKGSQVLPENLFQCGLLSPWVHRFCQESDPARAPHRVTASLGHPLTSAWGPPQAAGRYLFHHGPPWSAGGQPASTWSSTWVARDSLLQHMKHLLPLLPLLLFVLTNKEGLVEDVKVGGRLGCSDHEMVEFRILCGASRAIRRIKTLDLRRANFGLCKERLGGIPWDRALEGRGVYECWSLFKRHFLHAQEQCIPLRQKSSKGGRRPAWLNKELKRRLSGVVSMDSPRRNHA